MRGTKCVAVASNHEACALSGWNGLTGLRIKSGHSQMQRAELILFDHALPKRVAGGLGGQCAGRQKQGNKQQRPTYHGILCPVIAGALHLAASLTANACRAELEELSLTQERVQS